MSPPRFYFPQLIRTQSDTPALCKLTGPEARHAVAVLRLREGDLVSLFNGRGDQATAKIVSQRKDTLACETLQWNVPNSDHGIETELIIALPKGDRQRVLVDAITELGVTRLIPLLTERGVAQPTASALDRLERNVIEACKQCGRNRLLEITPPVTMDDLCRQGAEESPSAHGLLRLVAHPYAGGYPHLPLSLSLHAEANKVRLVIGPEGGLTEAEVHQLRQHEWQVVDLGNTILRIEVAAVAAMALVIGHYYGLRRSNSSMQAQ